MGVRVYLDVGGVGWGVDVAVGEVWGEGGVEFVGADLGPRTFCLKFVGAGQGGVDVVAGWQ